jgi:pyrroloquinoline quinone (PQQ) biosynthesis protein C
MNPSDFIRELEEEIRQHDTVQHSFLQRFASEPLTLIQIQTFGLQHYQLVKIFVNYMTNLLPRIPDPEATALFRVVFDDEFGQHTIFRSHPTLYRNFLKSLGLDDGAWGRVAALPEVSAFVEGHMRLTRDEDFLVGLGAVGPGHEFSIPTMFEYLVAGLKRNTQLTDEQIEYFTLHIIEDKAHAVVFNKLIVRHTEDEAAQRRLRDGALRSLALRRAFWDGLQRVVFS